MNIPDEVLRAAYVAHSETYVEAFERTRSRSAAREAKIAEYQVITDWALKEAAEVAKAWGRANEEGGYARSAFTVARKILALTEGTPDGQQ